MAPFRFYRIPAAWCVVLLFLCALPAWATTYDRFQCPNGSIISLNDRLSTVTVKCDPPTAVTRRTVTTGSLDFFRTVDVEEWIYNRGPTYFLYYLIFENGILKRIESGEYGK